MFPSPPETNAWLGRPFRCWRPRGRCCPRKAPEVRCRAAAGTRWDAVQLSRVPPVARGCGRPRSRRQRHVGTWAWRNACTSGQRRSPRPGERVRCACRSRLAAGPRQHSFLAAMGRTAAPTTSRSPVSSGAASSHTAGTRAAGAGASRAGTGPGWQPGPAGSGEPARRDGSPAAAAAGRTQPRQPGAPPPPCAPGPGLRARPGLRPGPGVRPGAGLRARTGL